MTKREWENEIEDKIYAEQERLIRKKYGARAANMANYGWGVDGSDIVVQVATKVYGYGVLISEATYPSNTISHEWS